MCVCVCVLVLDCSATPKSARAEKHAQYLYFFFHVKTSRVPAPTTHQKVCIHFLIVKLPNSWLNTARIMATITEKMVQRNCSNAVGGSSIGILVGSFGGGGGVEGEAGSAALLLRRVLARGGGLGDAACSRAVYERGTCVEVVFRIVSEMARRGLVWHVLVC